MRIINNFPFELLFVGEAKKKVVPNGAEATITLADLAAASGLAEDDIVTRGRYVFIQVQGAPVKLTVDGADPTDSNSARYNWEQDREPLLRTQNLQKMKFSGDGGQATLVYCVVRR